MSRCADNPATGRIGCGQTFGGESQHCVARVPWSTHPDGRAHVTASLSTIEYMWTKGDGTHPADPSTLGYEPNANGRWRRPLTDEEREQMDRDRWSPHDGHPQRDGER